MNLDRIADDTEATNWASLTASPAGRSPSTWPATAPQPVTTVNVSALLRPAITGDADPGAQNGFSALRSFADPGLRRNRRRLRHGPGSPGLHQRGRRVPRWRVPAWRRELNLRSFRVPTDLATHVRLEVLTSQCTGGPATPVSRTTTRAAATDCATASPSRNQVRIAEFQVFGK